MILKLENFQLNENSLLSVCQYTRNYSNRTTESSTYQ